MHIKLINKYLYFEEYKVKCAIGKRGISSFKKEGDLATPRGQFKFTHLFYRKDKISSIETSFKKIPIKKNMGWCDDPRSKYYNKFVTFPFKQKAEKLYLKNNLYDIILVTNYNQNPTIKRKGSAIFLHITTKKYLPTRGCVAITEKDFKLLLKKINKKTLLKIY